MKKVLIINPFFNQKERIGSVRLNGLAKFLPKFGWEPHILTSGKKLEKPAFKTFVVEYEDQPTKWKKRLGMKNKETLKGKLGTKQVKNKNNYVDLVLRLWEEIFAYPDSHKDWCKPAVDFADELMEQNKFDIIMSSSYPMTSHLIASYIKKTFGVPWVADFRDLWTQNPYTEYSIIRRIMEKRLEINTLKDVDAITTTTESFTESLRALHKNKDIIAIMNGFDPDKVNPGIPLTKKLNITYTGQLYDGKRDPELLFKALKDFEVDKTHGFKVDFYGPNEEWLNNEIRKYGLEQVVKVHGMVAKEKAINKQMESQLLLLLTWDDPKEKDIIPGKIFEYLAAKRPILSIGPSDSYVKELLNSTNAGFHLSDLDGIKSTIRQYYEEFKLNGKIKYRGLEGQLNKYNQICMTKKFVEIFEKYS